MIKIATCCRTALLLLGVFLGGGCTAVSEINIVPPLSGGGALPQTHGLVVARVVNAGSVPIPFNYLTITPKNLYESSTVKPSRLSSLDDITGDSTLFVSSIIPGSYSVSNILAFYSSGESWYRRPVSGDIEMGTFNVAENQITDLGTLVYYPKVVEDRYVDTLFRIPNSKALPVLTELLPFLEDGDRNVVGWDEDDLGDGRMTKYASALQNPVVFNDRLKAPDDSIYFVGKLGTILRRTAGGNWQIDAVETDSDLNCIASNDAGDVITAGEFGTVYFKPSGGKWSNISLDNRYNIQKILLSDGGTIIDAIAKRHKELAVFRMHVGDHPPKWEKLLSYTSRAGWKDSAGNPLNIGAVERPEKTDRRISYIDTLNLNGKGYLYFGTLPGGNTSPFTFSRGMVVAYNPQSWELEISDGFNYNIDRIIPAGAVKLGMKQPAYWSITNEIKYYRFDSAQNKWAQLEPRFDHCRGLQKINSACKKNGRRIHRYTQFGFISSPVFTTKKDAFAIVKYPKDNMTKYETLFAVTDNGGDSWIPAEFELPNEYCTSTVPELEDGLLIYCNGMSSDFYESFDDGKSWDHVRQHQNF